MLKQPSRNTQKNARAILAKEFPCVQSALSQATLGQPNRHVQHCKRVGMIEQRSNCREKFYSTVSLVQPDCHPSIAAPIKTKNFQFDPSRNGLKITLTIIQEQNLGRSVAEESDRRTCSVMSSHQLRSHRQRLTFRISWNSGRRPGSP